MFKKVILGTLAVCCLCGVLVSVGCSKKDKKEIKDISTPDLSTKEMAVKSITYAVMYDKVELFWNCLTPGSQRLVFAAAKQTGRNPENAKGEFFLGFKKDFQKTMRKFENDPEKIAAALAGESSTFPLELLENKWYLNLEGTMIQKKSQPKRVASLADRTSKEKLAENFVSGVLSNNFNLVWDCLSPKTQSEFKALKDNQGLELEDIKKNYVKKIKPNIDKYLEKHKHDFEKTVADFVKDAPIVNINAEWFYQE